MPNEIFYKIYFYIAVKTVHYFKQVEIIIIARFSLYSIENYHEIAWATFVF